MYYTRFRKDSSSSVCGIDISLIPTTNNTILEGVNKNQKENERESCHSLRQIIFKVLIVLCRLVSVFIWDMSFFDCNNYCFFETIIFLYFDFLLGSIFADISLNTLCILKIDTSIFRKSNNNSLLKLKLFLSDKGKNKEC